jgi:LacI family transcriptional regulator
MKIPLQSAHASTQRGNEVPSMAAPVTLAAVARAAQVALGTASRVLNNFTDVSADARQRVLDAMRRLNYEPLRNRRATPARRRSAPLARAGGRIGLVLLGRDETLVQASVLSELLHGVEAAVGLADGSLHLVNLPTFDRVPEMLKGSRLQGLIVKTSDPAALPEAKTNALIRSLQRFPIVWMWAKPAAASGDLCTFNHETAASLALRHLAALGHRRVAFLHPKEARCSFEHLRRKFEAACATERLALQVLESPGTGAPTSPENAQTDPAVLSPLVDQWLAFPKARRPTAIFVPADNIAAHLYTALSARGLAAPDDVGIISCNYEKPLARALKPRLTTLDVHAGEIGRRAVDQLMWRIERTAESAAQTLLLEPTLVIGDSIRPI